MNGVTPTNLSHDELRHIQLQLQRLDLFDFEFTFEYECSESFKSQLHTHWLSHYHDQKAVNARAKILTLYEWLGGGVDFEYCRNKFGEAGLPINSRSHTTFDLFKVQPSFHLDVWLYYLVKSRDQANQNGGIVQYLNEAVDATLDDLISEPEWSGPFQPSECAKRFEMSPSGLKRWIADGKIHVIRITTKKWLIREDEVRKFGRN